MMQSPTDEPATFNLGAIPRHAAAALTAYARAARWHRNRALARGLKAGEGVRSLKVAARRAERLAAIFGSLEPGNVPAREWKRLMRFPFWKVTRSRRRAIAAAESDLVAVDIDANTARLDLDHAAIHQLRELEITEAMHAAMSAFLLIHEAIEFTLKGIPPTGWEDVRAWQFHVAEEMAALKAILRANGQ